MFSKLNLLKSIKTNTRAIKYYLEPTQIINKNFSNIKFPFNPDDKNKTNGDLVNEDFGLRQFVKSTYLWTGGAITSSIGISILGTKVDFIAGLFDSFELFIGAGFALSLGGIIGINFFKPKIHENFIFNLKKDKVYPILYSTNPVPRIISYGSLISGMGILMIPMFIAFPDAIIPAFATSSSVFGGAVYYALTRKTQELTIWGPTLYSCLFGLTGVSLLGLGSSLLIGQNLFASSAHLISLYGGIPLFTGLITYDTYKAIQMYREGEPDHLGCSVDLYLSFINLFVRLVEIIAKIQALTNYNNKDDDKNK
jgi:FtsH-binding integral membrane protein